MSTQLQLYYTADTNPTQYACWDISAGRWLGGGTERRGRCGGLRLGHGRLFAEHGQLLHGDSVAVERNEYERALQRVEGCVERPGHVAVCECADQREHPRQAHHQRQAHVDLEIPARPVDGGSVAAVATTARRLEPVVRCSNQPDSAEERHVVGGDRGTGREHEQRDQ